MRFLLMLPVMCALGACGSVTPASAEAPAANAASTPATATAPTDVSDEAMALLEQLERAGRHSTIKAQLDYTVVDRRLGDSEHRTGYLAWQAGDDSSPSKFRVTFETLRQGSGPRIRQREDYAFDGRWLMIAKHKIKQLIRAQIAGEGETLEPMRLGSGPFPVPFGQKAQEVIEYFHVETASDDSAAFDGDYLKLLRRPEHAEKINIITAEMWLDRETHLPVRILSRDDKKKETTVAFTEVEINAGLDEGVFVLPRQAGWDYRVEDWRSGIAE